jgi:hypothetical protein
MVFHLGRVEDARDLAEELRLRGFTCAVASRPGSHSVEVAEPPGRALDLVLAAEEWLVLRNTPSAMVTEGGRRYVLRSALGRALLERRGGIRGGDPGRGRQTVAR